MKEKEYMKLVPSIHKYLGELFRELEPRLKSIEMKIDALETKGVDYKGTFQKAITYNRGDVLTHSGSAWICLRKTNEAPGNCSSWQLMVKKGRDAR